MNNSLFNFLSLATILIFIITLILLIIFLVRIVVYLLSSNRLFPKKNAISILIGIVLVSGYFINYKYNLEFLPKGFINKTVVSPDEKHEIKLYNISAYFMDYKTVRAVVVNIENKKSKTIYSNVLNKEAEINWLDNKTVIIEGIKLNIERDTYNNH
ncbi:hypothetical protein CEQ21_24320 [Niallia circulans]|uniref:Uncharacterized protein n=1 Tax=Niallia circulans TaxID=1397 RepID=A0A553SNE7_NIACI|nr:DUF5412 family protein [Niallia circulans]TRZ38515.1 hypothetical protein CEQ21_24320 [Niallia circulans]